MYKLPYFTEHDSERMIAFIRQYPFAVVTGVDEQGIPVASHLPLMIRENTDKGVVLIGHMMKQTDHHKAFVHNNQALAIFNGPHTYISASWYQNPAVASTWNYMTVHVRGRINFLDDAGTYDAIRELTNMYEYPESPASFENIPADYIHKHIQAIAGFEFIVESINNVTKLSQNHHREIRSRIITELYKRNDEQSVSIAREMEKRLED